MGEVQRSSIQKRRSKRHSRRLHTQEVPQNRSPSKELVQNESEGTSEKDVAVLDEDFQNLYKDIFRSSTHDFWQSQPAFTPTIELPSSLGSSNGPPPPGSI